MKKTLIIALLVALVLGIFTACNGDVFEDLVEGQKTITLKINEFDYVYGWTFDGEENEIVVSIPSGCTKWVDMVGEKIKVYFNDFSFELTLGDVEEAACYIYTDNYEYIHAYLAELLKGTNTISINSDITPGETYMLYIDYSFDM